jgi:predicted ATPase/class 3 adenylate cyclase
VEGAKMQCPKCQFENREGAKFCIACGNKLEINCSKCSHLNPPESKYCEECGSQLDLPSEQSPKDLSFDEKLIKIQRYLPKGLTEKILSQKDKIEGERKQVTVMFCDMEGFTSLSEMLGMEEAYSIMDQVYEILIHKVHDYEGTVNEMTGDGIMALFGAPIALEDAPQRAIRSAYAIHREMTRFSDKMKQEKEGVPSLKMRIGIHTGPVVVGTLGNDLRVEFKAVGDTVNLASRIENIAEPGSTYVTEETFKLTEGFFRFEALGKKKIKGKEGAIKTYRVVAPSTRRTKFDVSAERGLTPFVGRDRELELLLDGFERTKAGRGQAFSIMAEAGVGKSRLLYEFRKAVANEDVTFMEGKCLSYSRGVAYHPVIDILKSNFDITENNDDIGIRERVIRGLNVLGVDEASTLPYLLELLSVKDSGIDKILMSPEAKKERIIEAVKGISLKGSEIRPLIMAVEDLHWIDRSTEDYLKSLLNSISGARIFLIFTYRPEFVHTWGGRSYHSQVNLNRLSNRECLMMVYHLLGTEALDRDLENLILEKTEGVPFFVEELVRSLKDLKIIKRSDSGYHLAESIEKVAIPSTIQDVIMARVDALPEGAKKVLQTGSVIEREFSYKLIKQVEGHQEPELLSFMSILKDSELLYERGIYPESSYVFKHALTREVVYDSILAERKKRLHEKAGNTIEELYKENIAEHYEVLVEHFIAGENFEKGADYCKLSSRKSEKAASLNDAIEYAKKGVDCIERRPESDSNRKQLIDARTILGLYYLQMVYPIEAKAAVEPIIDLAIDTGYKRRLAQIYTLLGTYSFYVEEDYPKALELLQTALKISDEVNDIVSSVLANHFSGEALGQNCDFEKSNYHFEKALALNKAAKNLWGISVNNSSSSFCACLQGNVGLGYQLSKEAILLAEDSGDIYSKTWAYNSHGISCYIKGLFDEAIKNLVEGADYSERINLSIQNAMSYYYLGQVYFDIGEYQKSKFHHEKAIGFIERGRFYPSWLNLAKLGLAIATVMTDKERINLKAIYEYEAMCKAKYIKGTMQYYIAEILLNIDDQHIPEAEDWLRKAIETNKRNDMRWNLGRSYNGFADLFKRKGDKSKAKEKLNKAIKILKECGADGWVEKYEKELTDL